MKRSLCRAAAAALLFTLAGAAGACDDHFGECAIEDWRWRMSGSDAIIVEGVATCDTGEIRLRLYDGADGPFLGVDRAYIKGHTFKALVSDVSAPNVLALKYSIEPR